MQAIGYRLVFEDVERKFDPRMIELLVARPSMVCEKRRQATRTRPSHGGFQPSP